MNRIEQYLLYVTDILNKVIFLFSNLYVQVIYFLYAYTHDILMLSVAIYCTAT